MQHQVLLLDRFSSIFLKPSLDRFRYINSVLPKGLNVRSSSSFLILLSLTLSQSPPSFSLSLPRPAFDQSRRRHQPRRREKVGSGPASGFDSTVCLILKLNTQSRQSVKASLTSTKRVESLKIIGRRLTTASRTCLFKYCIHKLFHKV